MLSPDFADRIEGGFDVSTNVAYVYKVFTHPNFRGRRLSCDRLSEAATVLGTQG